MIIGKREEPFTFERLFSNSSAIFGDEETHEEFDTNEFVLEPSYNAPRYKIREATLEARRLGRPLTDEEMERFRVQ